MLHKRVVDDKKRRCWDSRSCRLLPFSKSSRKNGADAVYFGLAQLNMRARARKSFHYAEAFEEDQDDLQKAAEGCPVQIIKVIK